MSRLDAAERAELEAFRAQAKHHEDECGAMAGAAAIDRVDRITALASGIAALAQVFEAAMHTQSGYTLTPKGWAPALGLVGTLARDIGHETSAMWDQVRAKVAPNVDPILAACDDTLQAHRRAGELLATIATGKGAADELVEASREITQATSAMERAYLHAARIGGAE